jgi:hypothetical protein
MVILKLKFIFVYKEMVVQSFPGRAERNHERNKWKQQSHRPTFQQSPPGTLPTGTLCLVWNQFKKSTEVTRTSNRGSAVTTAKRPNASQSATGWTRQVTFVNVFKLVCNSSVFVRKGDIEASLVFSPQGESTHFQVLAHRRFWPQQNPAQVVKLNNRESGSGR